MCFYNEKNPEVLEIQVTKYREDNKKEVMLIEKEKGSNIEPLYKNKIKIIDIDNRVLEECNTTTMFLANQDECIRKLSILFSYMFNAVLDKNEKVRDLRISKRKDILKLDKPTTFDFFYDGMEVKIDIMLADYILVSFIVTSDGPIEGFDFDFLGHVVEMTVCGNEDFVGYVFGVNNVKKVITEYLELDRNHYSD